MKGLSLNPTAPILRHLFQVWLSLEAGTKKFSKWLVEISEILKNKESE